jgi:hypothetical protein
VANISKQSAIAYSPEIYQVIDSVTDEINSCVSSGNLATINGRQLKFDKHNQARREDSSCLVFAGHKCKSAYRENCC